jgi:hypothetical protein
MKITIICLVCFFSCNIFSFCQDTIFFKKNNAIYNISDDFKSPFDSVKLITSKYDFDGYLLFQFDENKTKVREFKGNSNLELPIFWVGSINDLNNDSLKYQYVYMSMIFYENAYYISDTLHNNFLEFLKYFYSFATSNKNNLKIYLFRDYCNPNSISIFNNKFIWKNNNGIYLIFRTKFYTAIFEKLSGIKYKFFIPISDLQLFELISDEEAKLFNLEKVPVVFY